MLFCQVSRGAPRIAGIIMEGLCMYVCMYVRTYVVGMYVCVCEYLIHVHIYIYMYI